MYKKEDQGEQSYSERQMYQAALERLAGEFAAVQNVDQSDADDFVDVEDKYNKFFKE